LTAGGDFEWKNLTVICKAIEGAYAGQNAFVESNEQHLEARETSRNHQVEFPSGLALFLLIHLN
jgi:hypothetical protein